MSNVKNAKLLCLLLRPQTNEPLPSAGIQLWLMRKKDRKEHEHQGFPLIPRFQFLLTPEVRTGHHRLVSTSALMGISALASTSSSLHLL